MSAYDNPTIIKDDSAMIWAQAFGGAGQAFTESFRAATKEREAKEKEARLEAEKREKESKELLLNGQIADARIQNENQADYNQVVASEPKDADAGLIGTFNNDVLSINETFGKIKAKKMTTPLTEEDKKVLDSEGLYLATRQGILKTTGAISANINSYSEIAGGDGSGASINGSTPLERTTNWYTQRALDPKNVGFKDIATKKFEWDKKDFSKATLSVSTKFNTKKDLHEAIKKINPSITPEDLEKITAESNKDITKNDDDSYLIHFKRPMDGSWDGSFYSAVPTIFKGDELKNAGVVDEKGAISSDLLGSTTSIQDKNYKGPIPGSKGFWRGTVVKEEEARNKLYPVAEARIKSLLAVDFKDLNVLQGFLTNRLGQGTSVTAEYVNGLEYPEKVKLLTNLAIEKELIGALNSTTTFAIDPITKVNTRYLGNPKDIERVDPEKVSTSEDKNAGGKTKKQLETEAEVEASIAKVIKMDPKKSGEFIGYEGRKVTHADGIYTIDGGKLEGTPIATTREVIDYLRTGVYGPNK